MTRVPPFPESPAYQHGRDDARLGIVLSAPGRAEEKAGHPAAGQTGRTLDATLVELNRLDPRTFPYRSRLDCRVVNASPDIHYVARTGSSEATDADILTPANLARLARALDGLETVLALGRKADLAVRRCGFAGTVLTAFHPSMQAINRVYQVSGETPAARNAERVALYARDILKGRQPAVR